ncbi:MAG TPA: hypothetical protein VNC61_09695 [Acidimicrobiales bacterium]|nr:hypothetical protein [Acidimicrobiales bacterium]
MDGKRIIAAATRFKEAWDAAARHTGQGLSLSDLDLVEMHEAALGLIAATGASDLQGALDVLRDFEA